jgi:hypothetical protein
LLRLGRSHGLGAASIAAFVAGGIVIVLCKRAVAIQGWTKSDPAGLTAVQFVHPALLVPGIQLFRAKANDRMPQKNEV